MAKHPKQWAIKGQFAWQPIDIKTSPVWEILGLAERRVLDRIELELARHAGKDNGNLPVTFDDFQRYGIDRKAIGPALRVIGALGVAQITEHGRAGNADFRKPNLFRLTYRPTNDGETWKDPTDEWRNIKTKKEARALARAARLTSEKLSNSMVGISPNPVGKSLPRIGRKFPPQTSKPPAKSIVGKTTLLSRELQYRKREAEAKPAPGTAVTARVLVFPVPDEPSPASERDSEKLPWSTPTITELPYACVYCGGDDGKTFKYKINQRRGVWLHRGQCQRWYMRKNVQRAAI
jgi:hypothetical protein